MNRVEFSVSLSVPLARLIEDYAREHGLESKSRVVERALDVVREQELKKAYAAASRDVDAAWEVTASDGLSTEVW